MFYDIFTSICKEKGYSPTSVLQRLNISTSKLTAWKNGSMPNSSFLLPISELLEVSIDYLLTGKEKSSSEVTLSPDEQKLLTYFKDLSDIDKGIVIGRAEALAESNKTSLKQPEKAIISESKDTPKLQRAYMVSRSTDNTPPRVVEGDFSDILNAPDATDEY